MNAPDATATIVFDGTCVLCNGWVDFLLRHDTQARYRFAAIQGANGRALLASHGLDPDDPSSFLLIDADGAHRDTDAIRRVVTGLGGAWRVAHAMGAVPAPLRDRLYRFVARNRYRLFGRHAACRIPAPHEAHRFLD
ncbi:Membrane protein [Lysobacter dokdonensis DS-58]|uniref:Membrane protein n=1 Tax=Lysobacter dokdonensis DS-58 TaxID=1300345 RepID=A0A0A2WKN0_9GAMM|nr:thiol-disulfide oxidoreductase DCC family protein [Lysobacter dokdonensis]KGQ18830.1 Membrane protein [Lysobacter dokdonensis DS-58]